MFGHFVNRIQIIAMTPCAYAYVDGHKLVQYTTYKTLEYEEIRIKYMNGPRMEPWGTPVYYYTLCSYSCFALTNWN